MWLLVFYLHRDLTVKNSFAQPSPVHGRVVGGIGGIFSTRELAISHGVGLSPAMTQGGEGGTVPVLASATCPRGAAQQSLLRPSKGVRDE